MASVEKIPEEQVARGSQGAILTLPSKKDANLPSPANKDKSLVQRLKKAGLDPQKLLDLALPATATKSTAKLRHRLILMGFFAIVALPSIAFSAYMFFWASDQYHSTTAFSVRSSNPVAATEILGMVLDGGGESTTSNSYIVTDYLQSQEIVEEISGDLSLQSIFNHSNADWLFRMGDDLPIESKLKFWNRMVDVSFDATSGVILVEVRTFNPDDSVSIADAILDRSENLVNQLSAANRRQTVRFAEEAVAKAEARLKAIRKQMLAYREQSQEINPEENAKIAAEMIAGLDQERAVKEAEKKTLMSYLDTDSPRIRMLSQQIEALDSQIEKVRQRLGAGVSSSAERRHNKNSSLSFRIADYSDLALEEEFAQQLYVTSLAGLEKARQEADSKSLYLATFIKPTLSESAQYPNRLLYSLAVFLFLAGLWSVAVLMYYNVRDRT